MKTEEMDLSSGSLWKKIIVYSIPLMFSNILQVLFNMSDIAVVGKFAGAIALGAVGSTSILVTLFTGVLIGLSSGVNALTALHIGSRNHRELKETVHTSLILCFAAGLLIMVLGIAFSRPILTAMHTKDELMADALLYLRIYLCGMPALGLYNFGNAVLSAAGDTKRPLYYLLFSGVVNVVLNLFFVIVCRWSVAGVAAASIFSQYLSAFLILYVLFRSTEGFGLRFQAIKLKYNIMKRVMQIGIPAAYRGGNLYLSISLSGALYR
jgi:putative MATE family efflux protein